MANNNERVSQLIELGASGIRSEDLLLITDMSERESKKLQIDSILSYIENSGSFIAVSAAIANTASYVNANNVDGMIALSAMSSQSISASYALQAKTSSYANTASWAEFALTTGAGTVNADTASFIQYSGFPNGTSSYSLRSQLADASNTAYNLFYNGSPNGTASWAVESVNSKTTDTASYGDSFQIWYSGTNPSQYGKLSIFGATNDGLDIFVSGSSDDGTAYFRTADNGTEPFLFQTWNTSVAPVDRVRISYDNSLFGSALLTVYGNVSSSLYKTSIQTGVSFLGTASYAVTSSNANTASSAVTASYVVGGGPRFISPIVVVSSTYATAWTAFTCSTVPAGTRAVILDGWVGAGGGTPGAVGFVNLRQDSFSPTYVLFSYTVGVTNAAASGQGVFPINSSKGLEYELTKNLDPSGNITVRLIGYY